MVDRIVYKIMSAAELEQMQLDGVFRGSPVDIADALPPAVPVAVASTDDEVEPAPDAATPASEPVPADSTGTPPAAQTPASPDTTAAPASQQGPPDGVAPAEAPGQPAGRQPVQVPPRPARRRLVLPARLHQLTVGQPDQDRVQGARLQARLPGQRVPVPPSRRLIAQYRQHRQRLRRELTT